MAMVIGDANATLKDLTAVWENMVRETRPSLVPRLCSEVKSDGAYEKYPIPTNVKLPRKWEGERVSTGIDVNVVYELENEEYELTVDIKRSLIEDAKAYQFTDVVAEAAQSMVLLKDYLLSQLIANGASAGYTGYDGNIFYGDTHLFANAGSNNIDNSLAQTGTTVDNIKTDIGLAVAALRGFKDNAGRLINPLTAEGAGQLIVQCPLSLEQTFRTALQASIISQTDNMLKGIADLAPDGYLSGSGWYLHMVGQPQKPFVFQKRTEIETVVLGPGSEFCTNTGKVRIAGRERFKLGYNRFERSVKVA